VDKLDRQRRRFAEWAARANSPSGLPELDFVLVEISTTVRDSDALNLMSLSRFFTTKGVGEGTGMGLDTVYRIVRAHAAKSRSIGNRAHEFPGSPALKVACVFESILCQVTDYDSEILKSLIELAVEIAAEGVEGRRIGTLFTLGR